jgi:SAM-dependent methyltransferase
LARKGFKVTGVDLSSYLLTKARELADRAEVQIEWIQQDMRLFSRPNAFDMCLSMFTSFGYFKEKEDDRTVLRNSYENLTKGGVFVIDVSGKEWLAKHFQPTASHELADGSLLVERREICDDWSRVRNTWIMLKGGAAQEFRFEHTVYSAQELKILLADAGFQSVAVYGSLDGAEYGLEAARLIAVARK